MMKDFSSWIDIEYKTYYLDSDKRGLRTVVHKGVSIDGIRIVQSFLSFIRKRYFFPIRCYIHLTNNEKYRSQNKGFCSGVFFSEQEKPKRYCAIYLPMKRFKDEKDWTWRLFCLTRLITYYFQWYFECEKEYSHRSLEIEATKMATYLVNEYLGNCDNTTYRAA